MYAFGFDNSLPNQLNDEVRKRLFEADRQMKLENVNEAIAILTAVKTGLTSLYNMEKINRRLVDAYKTKREYLSIIVSLVDAYLTNNNLIKRIDLKQLLSDIRGCDDKFVKSSIYFVIFTYVCDKNNYNAQRIAYSNYMGLNSYKSIEDVLKCGEEICVIVFFLHKICTQHLLKRDIILNPKGDKADEIRIG
ncbi:MAG TPA: hypothetical protein VIO64_11130 [Pseudobacteroides sp.]|uniref:hypothetical protein n=1 Tax=Pseudobacteroides sp. TaxID=1968840 RepID=UPI002F95897A